ncbi:MAG: hypothetical protein HGA22_07430 [Clostridiales bacterium]|nr:hypothetical protein [Clostridiales bacterium]
MFACLLVISSTACSAVKAESETIEAEASGIVLQTPGNEPAATMATPSADEPAVNMAPASQAKPTVTIPKSSDAEHRGAVEAAEPSGVVEAAEADEVVDAVEHSGAVEAAEVAEADKVADAVGTNPTAGQTGCEGKYSIAGAPDDAVVEQFVEMLQGYVINGDMAQVARLVGYPINVTSGEGVCTLSNSEEFLKEYDTIFNDGFKRALTAAATSGMFCDSNGIMFGSDDKNIWIAARPGMEAATAGTEEGADSMSAFMIIRINN